MAFRVSEHCDVCAAEVDWLDYEGDHNWNGIRFGKPEAISLTGVGTRPRNLPICIPVTEQTAEEGKGSFGCRPMPDLVVPGVVCSMRCLETHMLSWLERMKTTRPDPPVPPKPARRIVLPGDEA